MDIKNLIALSMVKGVGPSFIKNNISRIELAVDCYSIIKNKKPEQEKYLEDYLAKSESIINDCILEGIDIISLVSPEYPSLLKEISNPPCVLYMMGNRKLISKCIAIIGTRNSSELGNRIASRLGEYFSKDYSICNGLVEGIDENSIYSNGGVVNNVVGIISGGLCYKETCSKRHVKLIEDVLSTGGLIISEYPPHQKEDKYSGSKASRIQAGLSHGLILVESSVDGGSKYTIESFSKLGRPLGVIQFSQSEDFNSNSFGANRLIASKKIMGIAEMLNLKTSKKINVDSITVIEGKKDYEIFCKRINDNDKSRKNTLF